MRKNEFRHLEFFELLKDHVVGHVVKETVARRQDDVAKLHIKGGAVGRFGARVCEGDTQTNKQTNTRTHTVRQIGHKSNRSWPGLRFFQTGIKQVRCHPTATGGQDG